MATANKNLNQPSIGSTSWGTPLNDNSSYTDLAFGGLATITIGSGDVSRSLMTNEYIPLTMNFVSGAGTRSANITYSLPSGVGGSWMVYNNAGTVLSTYSLIISTSTPAVTTSSVTIPTGGPYVVTCNTTTGISIVPAYLTTGAVTTAKLADSSVTTIKIADASSTTTGVTYGKMQYVSSTSRILGRKTAAAGIIEELSTNDVLSFIGSTQGQLLYRDASAWNVLSPGTSGQFLKTNGSGQNPSWGGVVNQLASQSVTGVSSVTFTGIPATAKWISIVFSQVEFTSATAAEYIYVRLGTSGGIVSTGYTASSNWLLNDSGGGGNAGYVISTDNFIMYTRNGYLYPVSGAMRVNNLTGNTWVSDHTLGGYYASNSSISINGGGSLALSGALTQIQILASTSTFASGTISVMYM